MKHLLRCIHVLEGKFFRTNRGSKSHIYNALQSPFCPVLLQLFQECHNDYETRILLRIMRAIVHRGHVVEGQLYLNCVKMAIRRCLDFSFKEHKALQTFSLSERFLLLLTVIERVVDRNTALLPVFLELQNEGYLKALLRFISCERTIPVKAATNFFGAIIVAGLDVTKIKWSPSWRPLTIKWSPGMTKWSPGT